MEAKQEYQLITLENLKETLEYNNFIDQGYKCHWDAYLIKKDVAIYWDMKHAKVQWNVTRFDTGIRSIDFADVDLMIVALQRKGITITPLPVKKEFDIKKYLLDSGLFEEWVGQDYIRYFQFIGYNALEATTLINTQENADCLIELAEMYKKIKFK